MNLKLGLSKKKANKLQKNPVASVTAFNSFPGDEDETDKVFLSLKDQQESQRKKQDLEKKQLVQKQTDLKKRQLEKNMNIEIVVDVEESVYQYDEVYNNLKEDSSIKIQEKDKTSRKNVANMIKAKKEREKRKLVSEDLLNQAISKKSNLETFVTSAYSERMKEIKQSTEEEESKELNESNNGDGIKLKKMYRKFINGNEEIVNTSELQMNSNDHIPISQSVPINQPLTNNCSLQKQKGQLQCNDNEQRLISLVKMKLETSNINDEDIIKARKRYFLRKRQRRLEAIK